MLPFWGGERSPGWADDARGAIVGLRLHTRPVDVLRALLEAVALRFGELDAHPARGDADGREVVATGGALLHSPAWMQIMADVLGRPVLASTEPEASSRGVGLLALETFGCSRSRSQHSTARHRRFEPRAEHTAALPGRRRAAATTVRSLVP